MHTFTPPQSVSAFEITVLQRVIFRKIKCPDAFQRALTGLVEFFFCLCPLSSALIVHTQPRVWRWSGWFFVCVCGLKGASGAQMEGMNLWEGGRSGDDVLRRRRRRDFEGRRRAGQGTEGSSGADAAAGRRLEPARMSGSTAMSLCVAVALGKKTLPQPSVTSIYFAATLRIQQFPPPQASLDWATLLTAVGLHVAYAGKGYDKMEKPTNLFKGYVFARVPAPSPSPPPPPPTNPSPPTSLSPPHLRTSLARVPSASCAASLCMLTGKEAALVSSCGHAPSSS